MLSYRDFVDLGNWEESQIEIQLESIKNNADKDIIKSVSTLG